MLLRLLEVVVQMIKNKTRKFTIIKNAKLCTSVFSKAFGFMFRFRKPDYAVVFIFNREVNAALHMFFVFFPIDVLFLNKNKKVVDMKKSFKPFSYYSPRGKSQYIIELPVGLLKNTALGDKIEFAK